MQASSARSDKLRLSNITVRMAEAPGASYSSASFDVAQPQSAFIFSRVPQTSGWSAQSNLAPEHLVVGDSVRQSLA